MTIRTLGFKAAKQAGRISKAGKGRFLDGGREYERTLWRDAEDGDLYVMLNGEAYIYRPYRTQIYDYTIGRI